jgi:hypothetical protein
METSDDRRNRGKRPRLLGNELWERWYTRVTVIIGVLAAVVVIAVCRDPDTSESWHAKTWELVHDVITRSHAVEGRSR